ncbi:Ser/Thr protein phosphatase family [Beauveria brongniartii RCEF 3172]|uniref:Ser/Thr protein phosphatase family n=1 Tax=Beauveria brongniartii RCEF 3172 TaxID=1081107 RepID=A0A162JCA0_9HYPO|nr:Ser/Thr protein phosphatase family [Beauveria brongniartii RCEF 3172]
MPRLGPEISREHRRFYTIMLAAIIFTIIFAGLWRFSTAPLMSLRAWTTASQTNQQQQQQQPNSDDDNDVDNDVDTLVRHIKFDEPTMMKRLPLDVIPTAGNGRRLIVIGDIHGMDDALNRLLNRVGYDGTTDHIVAAGDMINKGPHSSRVLARLMELGASAVRGNHEDRVLLALASAKEQEEASESVEFPYFQERRSKKRDRETARQLSKEQIEWLMERPLILSADNLAMYIVHAGLVPGIHPLEQDPWAVMYMRSLIEPRNPRTHQIPNNYGDLDDESLNEDAVEHDDGSDENVHANIAFEDMIPVETHQGHDWADLWDLRQSQIRKRDRRTVVYGHDAKRGLQIGKYTWGLDSACFNGGKLTALVIHVSKKGHLRHKIRQVSCKKYKH